MLVIRFNRTGKRNHASFRVVLQEHTKAPGKRHVEILGSYDPHKKTTILNKDRILYWMGQGAQTSPVVTNLLVREGVIEGKKIAKKMPRPVTKEVPKAEETSVPVAEKPVVAEALAGEEVKAEEAKTTEAVPAEVSAPAEAAVEPGVSVKEETSVIVEEAKTPVEAEQKA